MYPPDLFAQLLANSAAFGLRTSTRRHTDLFISLARLARSADNGAMKTPSRRQIATVFAILLAALACACSPPAVEATIEGRTCSGFGSQACSTEPGSPRAECDGFSWRILEFCGAQGCNTLQTSWNILAYCGNTPPSNLPDGGGDGQGVKTDTVSSVQPDAGSTTAAAVPCYGWQCSAGLVCSGVGGCEAPGCLPPCGAGQRCVAKPVAACQDYCGGGCFTSQWCTPSAKDASGTCTTLPCALPALSTETYVATEVVLAEGASAVAAHCTDPAAGYSLPGAVGALTQLTKVFGYVQNPTQIAVASGLQTVALTANGAGWAWLSAKRLPGALCGSSPCPIAVSKADNLDSQEAPEGGCRLRSRNSSAGESKPWPLSLRNEFTRFDILLRRPTVQMASDHSEAWVCGAVTLLSLRAALTASYVAKGLSVPSGAELESLVPPDVDSDKDGKPDAWSVVLKLTLKPAAVASWSP